MFGYIDTKGNFAIKPQFHFPSHFRGGYACLMTKDRDCAAIDKNGDIVLPYQKSEDIIPTLQGTFFIEQDGTFRIYDKKNHRVGKFEASGIMAPNFDDSCDLYRFSLGESGLSGVVDAFGKVIIEPKYHAIHDISGGIASVGTFKEGSRGNTAGAIINMDDKIVFDDLWMGEDFIDDLMPIEKEDGGRVIINRKFQTVYTQNHEIEYFISRSHFGYYFSYRHDKSTVVYNSRNAKPLFEILAGEKIDPVAPGILAIKDEETNAHRFVDDNGFDT